ncbi:hypothetical protein [Streptomyces smyrnaeus]|uniref:hypothetical protein n=1 Tax=Streptomyces smyrnaeus TaxID=1387713 RepID=UPI0036940825
MSYPPPPGQNPNNPYAAPPQGAPGAAPYGYPQQGVGQPGYGGYPGGMPAYPGGPGGHMQPIVKMPGQVITARVLLFFAGALWTLTAAGMLIAALSASGGSVVLPGGVGPGAGSAMGVLLLVFLLYGGMAAVHIVPACLFGRGRSGTRITAIVAGSLNSLMPVIGFIAYLSSDTVDSSDGAEAVGAAFFYVLYLAITVLTVIFCSGGAAGRWFNRPQH